MHIENKLTKDILPSNQDKNKDKNKDKLLIHIVTYATVLFLILAGSPFLNIDTGGVYASNNPYFPPNIFNLTSSLPTSSGSYIFWNTNVSSNNRVYYGVNQNDVNSLTNGKWSMWNNNTLNVGIRISGLSSNTTYYYKPESWSYDIVNNSVSASSFMTLKPGVWTGPTEYMVSPPGWASSPINFRTVNISIVILNNNGRYISNLSQENLEAVIYNSENKEIGRINLNNSNGGYYNGNYILPDYLNEGGYTIRITGYPNIGGEFSVLRWGCANCHIGGSYPSTFDATTVHPKHLDTTQINTVHCGNDMCEFSITYTSTSQCTNCHIPKYPTWIRHPRTGQCSDCHKLPSGENAALSCENCHNDIMTTESYLSPRYGQDKHFSLACKDCHGSLTYLNLTSRVNCTKCHPRPGSILSNKTIPDYIENASHTTNKTVKCGLCHNRGHDIKSLISLDSTVCRNCHPGITHDGGSQCTMCHGDDPHNSYNPHRYYNTEQDCRGCHGITVDRHHLLVASGKYQCTNCHTIKYDTQNQTYYPEVIRNCLVCHRF